VGACKTAPAKRGSLQNWACKTWEPAKRGEPAKLRLQNWEPAKFPHNDFPHNCSLLFTYRAQNNQPVQLLIRGPLPKHIQTPQRIHKVRCSKHHAAAAANAAAAIQACIVNGGV
jgi:hypothetical protein